MTTDPQRKPGFDRLIISVLVLIGLALFVLAFTGCNTAAKHCRKAEAKLADAIHLCPSIMLPQVKTDTITIYTRPTAIAVGRSYSQASMDSLATICAALIREARSVHAEVVYERSPRQRLTKALCAFTPLDTTDGPCGIRVWEDAGKIRMFHHKSSERVDTVYKFVEREITAKPCPPVSRVRSWAWLWSIPAFALGLFLGLFFNGSYRHQ